LKTSTTQLIEELGHWVDEKAKIIIPLPEAVKAADDDTTSTHSFTALVAGLKTWGGGGGDAWKAGEAEGGLRW
jgi:hypothetical protein